MRKNTKKTDWDALRAMTDEEIIRNALDDPDAQPTSFEFWENARVRMPDGEPKLSISIRVNKRVLDFFKRSGRGYQSRINAVLEAYVNAEEGRNPRETGHSS